MSVLRCMNVVKFYGKRRVLNSVSIEINSGEIVGLLGPNGAGKTTIFNIILGVVLPDKGKIFKDTENISHLPVHMRARKGITYLLQKSSTFAGLTTAQNLSIILQERGTKKNLIKPNVESVLKEFHLYKFRDQKAMYLSGGEKRKLEIARLLMLEPDFVLLDEPFVGVDPLTIRDIQNMALELKKENIGVILTDHSVHDTIKIADRIYVLHKGEILAEGKPKEVLQNEKVIEKYLGEGWKEEMVEIS